jgi:sec-independent protein translocase protein TatC
MKELPLIEHLDELRRRLVGLAGVFIIFFIAGIFSANILIDKIQNDLILGKVILISLSPLEYFYTQMKIAFVVAVVLSSPFMLYHIFLFVKPALSKTKRIGFTYILPSFFLLFIIGVIFCYEFILKISITFFSSLATQAGIINLWSVEKFINFVVLTCLGFGLVFETPMILLILNRLHILSLETLRHQRKYVYVIIFILAAFLTPTTDFITQALMAVPLVVLYEMTLLIIRIVK